METENTVPVRKRRKKAEIFRKTSGMDDALLCETSRTWHALFEKHLSNFETFDVDLNSTYANTWLEKIKAFERHDTDETAVDGLEGTTEDVLQQKAKVISMAEGIEYFVKKAFPNDERILLEFGFAKIHNTNATASFVINAYTLLSVAEHYQPELSAAEMPAMLLSDYETACDQLLEKEIIQEYEKRVRIRKTTARIKMFNELFSIHLQIKKAAHIIYADQPERAKQFD